MWWFTALFFGAEKCASFVKDFCGKAFFLLRIDCEWSFDF
jgi:hypothetical protein